MFLSAVLFTAAHLFTKSTSLLVGLFLTGVIAGYVTYFTNSVLATAYLHVLANTAGELGFLGGGVTIVACFVISLSSSWRRRHSVNPVGLREL